MAVKVIFFQTMMDITGRPIPIFIGKRGGERHVIVKVGVRFFQRFEFTRNYLQSTIPTKSSFTITLQHYVIINKINSISMDCNRRCNLWIHLLL